MVHTIEGTTAIVHDVTMTAKLLTGEESCVYGDSSYLAASKHEDAILKNHSGKYIRYKLNHRHSQINKEFIQSQA